MSIPGLGHCPQCCLHTLLSCRRELGFEGVPHRETVQVLPTVNCLVELTQMPFTVVALSDIEIINLERVGFNLKNFDMAVVFKVGCCSPALHRSGMSSRCNMFQKHGV